MSTALVACGDVHADGDAPVFGAFLDELARRPPARLVLIGDCFEYWLETADSVAAQAATCARLRSLARRGWRCDLILGNREIVAGRRLAAATGCRLHWPGLSVEVGGRRWRFVHGDRLCRDPAYHLYASFMRGFWMRALTATIPAPLQDALARRMRAASARAGRRRRLETGSPKGPHLDPRRVAAAARRADGVIAGHIHRQERRRIADTELILVGDWGSAAGGWVEVDDAGAAHLRRFTIPGSG